MAKSRRRHAAPDPSGTSPREARTGVPSGRWLRVGLPAAVLLATVLAVAWATGGFSRWFTASGPPRETEEPDDAEQDSFPEPAFRPEAAIDQLQQQSDRVVAELLQEFPGHPAALHVKARYEYSLRNSAEAVKTWEECLRLDPANAEACLGLGSIAKETGDYARGEAMFRRTLELAPRDPRAPVFLGECQMKQGKFRESAETLESYLKTHAVSFPAASCLGQCYLQLGQFQEARQRFEECLKFGPGDRTVYYGLTRACARLGDREKARQYREKFEQFAAGDANARNRETPALSDLPLFRLVVTQTHIDAARLYQQQGRPEKAEEMWRRAAALDPRNIECRVELASLYERTGQDRQALRFCKQLREIEPGNPDRWFSVGLLEARLGRYDAARTSVGKALEMEPGNAEYRRAYELIEKGK